MAGVKGFESGFLDELFSMRVNMFRLSKIVLKI